MGIVFGKEDKKKTSKISSKDRAILELKRQRDRLKKYQRQCETIIQRETEVALQLLRQGRKDRAMLALKKKKYRLQCISKTEQQLLNLEEMVQSIEFASMQKTVFEALETGKDTLQKLNSQMSVADVELLMDESQEAIDRAMEIDELLSGKLTDEDEEAILAEFEVLQADVVEAGMKQLPTASTVTPPVTTDSTIVHTTVPMTVTGASIKTSTNTPIRNSPQKIEEKKGRKEKESPAMVLM